MNYRDFINYVQKTVERKLAGESVTVELRKTIKTGDLEHDGLVLQREGGNPSPVLYMDQLYELYNNNNITPEEIAERITEAYHNSLNCPVPTAMEMEIWENVRDKVTFSVMNTRLNSKYLEDAVFDEYLDLALVYFVSIIDENNELYRSKVQESFLKEWGIDKSQLKELAMQNTKRIFGIRLQDIHEVILEAAGIRDSDAAGSIFENDNSQMYLLTNKSGLYGASNMFMEDVMECMAEHFENDLYIIPSSVHEVMIIPAAGMYTKDDINKMIRDVNMRVLKPEDILSDHVYVYSREQKRILI